MLADCRVLKHYVASPAGVDELFKSRLHCETR